jgi:hypothetical protein
MNILANSYFAGAGLLDFGLQLGGLNWPTLPASPKQYNATFALPADVGGLSMPMLIAGAMAVWSAFLFKR